MLTAGAPVKLAVNADNMSGAYSLLPICCAARRLEHALKDTGIVFMVADDGYIGTLASSSAAGSNISRNQSLYIKPFLTISPVCIKKAGF